MHAQVEVEQEFEELNEQLFHAQQKVHELQQSLTESEAKRCAFCVHGATPPVPPFNCGQAVALALLWLEAIGVSSGLQIPCWRGGAACSGQFETYIPHIQTRFC